MALNGVAVNAFGSVSAVSTSGGHERAGHSPPPPKTFRRRNPRGPGHWRFTAARKRARNDRVGEGGSGRPGQLRPVHVRPAGTRRQHGDLGHHSARGDDPARGGAEGVVPCGSRRPMPVPEPAGHRRAPAAAQPSDDRRAAGRHPAAVHVDFGSQGGPWSRRARSCGVPGKRSGAGGRGAAAAGGCPPTRGDVSSSSAYRKTPLVGSRTGPGARSETLITPVLTTMVS